MSASGRMSWPGGARAALSDGAHGRGMPALADSMRDLLESGRVVRPCVVRHCSVAHNPEIGSAGGAEHASAVGLLREARSGGAFLRVADGVG